MNIRNLFEISRQLLILCQSTLKHYTHDFFLIMNKNMRSCFLCKDYKIFTFLDTLKAYITDVSNVHKR